MHSEKLSWSNIQPQERFKSVKFKKVLFIDVLSCYNADNYLLTLFFFLHQKTKKWKKGKETLQNKVSPLKGRSVMMLQKTFQVEGFNI